MDRTNLDNTKQYCIGLARIQDDSNGNKQFVWPNGKTYIPNVQSWPSTMFSYGSSEKCAGFTIIKINRYGMMQIVRRTIILSA